MTTPPSPPSEPTQAASSQATTILVLGILGIICCQLLGPVAWYMGKKELERIEAGQAAREGESNTRVGMILGIIGTALLALSLLFFFFFGGLAMFGAMMEGMSQ